MIPKISSDELNNVMEQAKEKLDSLDKKFELSKKDLEDKLKIINYESEYVESTLQKIKTGNYEKISGMKALASLDSSTAGKFHKYGSTVHAELIKSPINVFNLEMSALNEVYFREDVKVAINDEYDDKYLSILQHDTIKKPIFFNTYKDKINTIKIELSNLSMVLGPTRFNVIEIDPYLHGSFDILDVRIFEFTEQGTADENVAPIKLGRLPGVGIERIVLPRKINFYKIEIDIHVNYETYRNTSVVYPFGLKHIYFYDMDFKTDSYIITEIKSSEYIAYIKNDIILKTPFGERESKISLEDIELYLDRDGKSDTLFNPIEASNPDEVKEIARNVKTIYARIPVTPTTNLIGIAFDVVNRSN